MITSAGVVLAATFSALSIIPILFLAQIAFLVAFGVLLDTLVVRSLLVPALSYDIGRRIWWPSLLAGTAGPARTHRPHGLGSRAWSTVGLAGFASAGQGIHAPLIQAAGLHLAAIATAEPRARRAGPCGLPGRRDRARPRRACWRSTTWTSSCWPRPAGCTPSRRAQVIEAGLPVVVDKPLGIERQ